MAQMIRKEVVNEILAGIDEEIVKLGSVRRAILELVTVPDKVPLAVDTDSHPTPNLRAYVRPKPEPVRDGERGPTKVTIIREIMRRFNAPIHPSDIVTIAKGRHTPMSAKQAYNHLYVGQKKGWFQRTDRGWVLTELGREKP